MARYIGFRSIEKLTLFTLCVLCLHLKHFNYEINLKHISGQRYPWTTIYPWFITCLVTCNEIIRYITLHSIIGKLFYSFWLLLVSKVKWGSCYRNLSDDACIAFSTRKFKRIRKIFRNHGGTSSSIPLYQWRLCCYFIYVEQDKIVLHP